MALQHDGQYVKVALEEQGKLADDTAKVAIITGGTEAGSGMIFVAGADINDIASIASASDAEAAVQQVMGSIANLTNPVIAAVNGVALGGGGQGAAVVLERERD